MPSLLSYCLTTEQIGRSLSYATIRCVCVCILCDVSEEGKMIDNYAIICTHAHTHTFTLVHTHTLTQRAPPKTFDQQMSNLQGKIQAKEELIVDTKKEIKSLRKEAKASKDSKVVK